MNIQHIQKIVQRSYSSLNEMQQRWDEHVGRGFDKLNVLVNLHLKHIYFNGGEEGYEWGILQDCIGVRESMEVSLYSQILSSHRECWGIYNDLQYTLERMQAALQPLLDQIWEDNAAIFSTLPFSTFVELADTTVSMYYDDLTLKHKIMDGILKIKNRDSLSLLISAWSMQPLIDEKYARGIHEILKSEMETE